MAENQDQVFRALADANRRRILTALCRQPAFAGDLGRLVGLAPNAVSFHLKELRAAGLITSHREGRHLQYRPNLSAVGDFVQRVQTLFPADEYASAPVPQQRTAPGVSRPRRSPLPPAAPPSPPADAPDTMPTELL